MYMPKRPRSPFFSPYQPLTGFFGDRPHASTVPSTAGFCSSALPSGIQSPWFFSIACRSSIARRWYRSSVVPTTHTIAGGSASSARYIWYSEVPGGVLSVHGLALLPSPLTVFAFVAGLSFAFAVAIPHLPDRRWREDTLAA